jgi:hypothetical protein
MSNEQGMTRAGVGERQALVVAVSQYPEPDNWLPSCVQDAEAMSAILEGVYGFTRVHCLVDHEATVARVEEALATLVPAGASDGVGLIYFSGHGCQRVGEGFVQEALLLHDGLLTDERFVALTAALPGTLTGILDCCFSGGLAQAFASEEEPGYRRPKGLAPPPQTVNFSEHEPLPKRAFGTGRVVLSDGDSIVSFGDPEEAFPGILLSACGKDEVATTGDPGTDFLSPFTYALLQAVRASPASLYEGLMDEVRREVQRLECPQTPTLWTPPGRPWLARCGFLQPAAPDRLAPR